MRPAYNTRCWKCGIRLSVSDVLREKTVEKKKIKWFDVDDIIASEHSC